MREITRSIMNRESHKPFKSGTPNMISIENENKLRALSLKRGFSKEANIRTESTKDMKTSVRQKNETKTKKTEVAFFDRDGKPVPKEKLVFNFTIPIATNVNSRIKEYASFILSSFDGAYEKGK